MTAEWKEVVKKFKVCEVIRPKTEDEFNTLILNGLSSVETRPKIGPPYPSIRIAGELVK
jgi:hypothetical protein